MSVENLSASEHQPNSGNQSAAGNQSVAGDQSSEPVPSANADSPPVAPAPDASPSGTETPTPPQRTRPAISAEERRRLREERSAKAAAGQQKRQRRTKEGRQRETERWTPPVEAIEPPASRRGRTGRASAATSSPTAMRLQRYLASAGIGSRRSCEELIETGRVTVDGKTVKELGCRVEPDRQEIRLDGERVLSQRKKYYMVNKPKGLLCTSRDPQGRRRVIDLFPKDRERLFTVGRLDENSQGLLLVTNDGELANRLAHPSFEVHKIYQVLVAGVPAPELLEKLAAGLHFAEGIFQVAGVKLLKTQGTSAILEVMLKEGQNREIRRLLARVGHKVMRLERVALGPLKLGSLPPGEYRPLSENELEALQRCATRPQKKTRRRPRPDQILDVGQVSSLIRKRRDEEEASAAADKVRSRPPRPGQTTRAEPERTRSDRAGKRSVGSKRPAQDRPRTERPSRPQSERLPRKITARPADDDDDDDDAPVASVPGSAAAQLQFLRKRQSGPGQEAESVQPPARSQGQRRVQSGGEEAPRRANQARSGQRSQSGGSGPPAQGDRSRKRAAQGRGTGAERAGSGGRPKKIRAKHPAARRKE